MKSPILPTPPRPLVMGAVGTIRYLVNDAPRPHTRHKAQVPCSSAGRVKESSGGGGGDAVHASLALSEAAIIYIIIVTRIYTQSTTALVFFRLPSFHMLHITIRCPSFPL